VRPVSKSIWPHYILGGRDRERERDRETEKERETEKDREAAMLVNTCSFTVWGFGVWVWGFGVRGSGSRVEG
jgi:hypothetical protein